MSAKTKPMMVNPLEPPGLTAREWKLLGLVPLRKLVPIFEKGKHTRFELQ